MNRQPERTDATRGRFVEAFCLLYQTKPVEKITVKEIAALAGHNRVTFYQYFRDAYDVLEFLERELLTHVRSAITANIGRADMFRQFDQVFAGILDGNPELVRILLTGPNCGSTLERCKTAMLPVIMEAFHIQADDHQARAVLEFYLAGVVSLLKYRVDHAQAITTPQLAQIIRNFLQKAVLPQLTP